MRHDVTNTTIFSSMSWVSHPVLASSSHVVSYVVFRILTEERSKSNRFSDSFVNPIRIFTCCPNETDWKEDFDRMGSSSIHAPKRVATFSRAFMDLALRTTQNYAEWCCVVPSQQSRDLIPHQAKMFCFHSHISQHTRAQSFDFNTFLCQSLGKNLSITQSLLKLDESFTYHSKALQSDFLRN